MMRWVGRIMKALIGTLASVAAFLVAKAIFIAVAAFLSLGLSVASFAVPTLASVMSRVTAAIIGPPVVATAAETARFRREINTLRRQNATLNRQKTALTRGNENLRRRNVTLSTNNRQLSGTNRQLQRQIGTNRRVVRSAATRIGGRAVRTATRSIAAIPIESVPILGVATIIATTAWEIRDVCRTLDDMAEIQREMGDEPESTWHALACNYASVGAARAQHFGEMSIVQCRAAANEVRSQWEQLAKIVLEDAPDIMEATYELDAEIMTAAEEEYKKVNTICDCIEDILCDPLSLYID